MTMTFSFRLPNVQPRSVGGVDLLANKSHVDAIARERALADSDLGYACTFIARVDVVNR